MVHSGYTRLSPTSKEFYSADDAKGGKLYPSPTVSGHRISEKGARVEWNPTDVEK